MNGLTMPLLLNLDVSSLTKSLVNIASPTGHEGDLATAVENALAPLAHLDVMRIGDTVVARTESGNARRVLLAGHLDTAVAEEDPLSYDELGKLFGPGACDAKGALAVMLRAATLPSYAVDATFVLYDRAEGTDTDGLTALADVRPDLLAADLGVLLEPTNSAVSGLGADPADLPDLPLVAALAALAEPGASATAPPRCAGAGALTRLGIPAVAFGPGDPALAHAEEEYVTTAELAQCEYVLRTWLQA